MSPDEAPLTPLEHALVKALVSALVKELRRNEGDGTAGERPGDQARAVALPLRQRG